jgi:multicomponent Na+:H+ antiporter subunit E
MLIDRFSCLTCVLFRGFVFLCFWIVISGVSLENLVVGAGAATGASWASAALLPSAEKSQSFSAWITLILRMPFQALAAGLDVARRALDPALPLRPGFVAYSTDLPKGTAQEAFAALAALQPGAVPIRSDIQGTFDVHCLDVGLPITPTLAQEEAELRKALGLERMDG